MSWQNFSKNTKISRQERSIFRKYPQCFSIKFSLNWTELDWPKREDNLIIFDPVNIVNVNIVNHHHVNIVKVPTPSFRKKVSYFRSNKKGECLFWFMDHQTRIYLTIKTLELSCISTGWQRKKLLILDFFVLTIYLPAGKIGKKKHWRSEFLLNWHSICNVI